MSLAARSVVASNTSTTTTATYVEGTALDATYGHIAIVTRANATAPTTPSGWTLLPGSGASGTQWLGVYARRGNGTVNSITVVGATSVSSKIQLAAYSGVSADTFWVDSTSTGGTGLTTLASASVVSTEDGMTAVSFCALGGTAGGTGIAWSNSFVRNSGSSSTSSIGWAEKAIPTSGTSVSTTATWTSSSTARVYVLLLSTTPAAVGTTVTWRDSGGVAHSGTAIWRTSDGVAHNCTITYLPPPSPFRFAADQPFAITAPFNTSIGSGAVYESPTAGTQSALIRTGTAQVNSTNYSIQQLVATASDPLVTITDTAHGGAVYNARVPAVFTAMLGTDGHTVIVQPDGYTAYECYKFATSGANYTSTWVRVQDLRGTGITTGVRAAGISSLNGLIHPSELTDAPLIPHALAISIPDSMLDAPFIWPARAQDANWATAYSGTIATGTLFAINPATTMPTGMSAQGEALFWTLVNYGAYVVDRSTTIALYCDPDCNSTLVADLKTDWQTSLKNLLVRITNSTSTTVGGGGTPRQPAAPPLFES